MIELLVVITIIGVLVTIAIASFQTAQAKARDSRRKTDLDAFKKALELYKGDTSGGNYPGCNAPLANGACQITLIGDFSSSPLVLTPYFGNTFPQDPKHSGNCGGTPATGTKYGGNRGYQYCYWPQGTAVGGQYPGYIISACLENGNDQGDNTFTAPATADCNSDGNGANDRTYGFSNP